MNLGIINAMGNTPTVFIHGSPSYYAKLEGFNPFGSIKDRAAAYVLQKGYEEEVITPKTNNNRIFFRQFCNCSCSSLSNI